MKQVTSEMICEYLRHEWGKAKRLSDVARDFDINYRIVHQIVNGGVWNFTVASLNKVAFGFGLSTIEFMKKVSDFAKK